MHYTNSELMKSVRSSSTVHILELNFRVLFEKSQRPLLASSKQNYSTTDLICVNIRLQ